MSHITPAAVTTSGDTGWLYDFLRWVGVSQDTAGHISQVLVKPVAVVAILVIAFVVARLGSRIIRHWIAPVANRAANRSDSARVAARVQTMAAMSANVWRIVVTAVAVLTVLGTVGLNLTPLLAGATVVGATIGFGAQSLVRDLLAGFLLTLEDQFGIGDTITFGAYTGVVEDLTLRVTRLRDADGTVTFIANGDIREVTNSSRAGVAVVTVDVVVPIAVDARRLLASVHAAAEAFAADGDYGDACTEPPTVVGIVAAAADTLTARLTVPTTVTDRGRVESGLRLEVTKRLQASGAYSGPPASGTASA